MGAGGQVGRYTYRVYLDRVAMAHLYPGRVLRTRHHRYVCTNLSKLKEADEVNGTSLDVAVCELISVCARTCASLEERPAAP